MNWRRSSIAAIVVLPVLALFLFGLSKDPRSIPSPLPGQPAPEFTLQRLDPPATGLGALEAGSPAGSATESGEVSLATHRGQVVVLNFRASWCLACRDEHAPLSEVATSYRDRGVGFYGVLYNDKPEPARRWIKEMGGQSYPTLLDPGTRTAIDYGLYGVPETFFIDQEGRVAYKHIGPVTRAFLIRKLDEMLAVPQEQES
jgi:cytochrome c biogenesis protein CcmG/thiol:disulfide interchange protein DsbE